MSTVSNPGQLRASASPLSVTDRRAGRGGLNPAILGIELRRVMRNRRTMIFTLIFPIAMFLFIASSIPADQQSLGKGVVANVNAWLMVSMAIYGAVMASTSAGASVSVERASGWSRQLRLTPLRSWAYIVMKMIAALILGALATAATFAAGLLSGKAHADTSVLLLCAGLIIAGSLVFAAFGLFMGYLLPSDNAMQFIGPILAIMSMLGGIFFPITEGSAFDHFASFTPIYGLAKVAQWPLTRTVDGHFGHFSWVWAANLVAWALIFVAGAAWRFRRDTARV